MKYLIIPDVHNHSDRAEKIIQHVKADQIIFLGDYFDDFNDTAHDVTETAAWLRWSVNQENRIHLCGNHDIHYWFKDNRDTRCSGFEQYKSVAINNILGPEHWNKLKFFHVLDDWILSHGGVHPYWIDANKFRNNESVEITQEELVKKLERDSKQCIKDLTKGGHHWFIIAGFSRSRAPFAGGLLWCDFNQEFEPIKGIHQIVGHTPDRHVVRWNFLKEGSTEPERTVHGAEPYLSKQSSYNVCIDSYPALKWYAVLEEKKLSIHETEKI